MIINGKKIDYFGKRKGVVYEEITKRNEGFSRNVCNSCCMAELRDL